MKYLNNHPESSGRAHNRSVIEHVPVSALKVREGDPRRYSPKDMELAQAVLRQLPDGVPLPVVVNAAGEILVGGLFVAAAKKLGTKHLDVIRHEGLSAIEEKQYSVAINQLLSKGEWDPVAFEAWIRDFEAGLDDFSHLNLGFDNGELDNILGISRSIAGGGSEEIPSPAAKAISRPGMTWLLGQHRIMCGSATSPDDMKCLLAEYSAAMAIRQPENAIVRGALYSPYVAERA